MNPDEAPQQRTGWDVLVVGAGPAGSAAAGLLAMAGHQVLVLERDHFPRFHIGESLIPGGLAVLDRLGVVPDPNVFVSKRGATFICEATGRQQNFAFTSSMNASRQSAYQVERAGFDLQLRDRARAQGATIVHGVTVLEASADAACAIVRTEHATFEGRYLIDASGQSRLTAKQNGTVEPYRNFGSSAVFTHFESLCDEAMAELEPHHDVRIMVLNDGWGWIIPLARRRLSVGLVSKGRTTPELLESQLLCGPTVTRLTRGARRLDTNNFSNFSYRNTGASGPRFAAIGDAAAFLDPVFSSGVTLALHAAESVGDTVDAALSTGREADPDLLLEHSAGMERAYRTFSELIDRFYNTRIAQNLFLADVEGRPGREGVMTVLAGEVWRTDNPFQEMLLNAKRRRKSAKNA